MSNLYDITEDLLRLTSLIDDDDAELDEEALLDSWEGLEGELNDKVEKWLRVIRNKEADVQARKAEIARQQEKANRDQKSVDFMKATLVKVLNTLNTKKAGTAILSCSVANNGGKAPLIWAEGVKEDPDKLPVPYKTIETVVKANTDFIREQLEAGVEIPGVTLGERGQHLNIK